MICSTWIWALTWLLFAIALDPLILGMVTAISFIIVPIYLSIQFSYRLALIPDHLQRRVNSMFRLIALWKRANWTGSHGDITTINKASPDSAGAVHTTTHSEHRCDVQ